MNTIVESMKRGYEGCASQKTPMRLSITNSIISMASLRSGRSRSASHFLEPTLSPVIAQAIPHQPYIVAVEVFYERDRNDVVMTIPIGVGKTLRFPLLYDKFFPSKKNILGSIKLCLILNKTLLG
ncbi:unnamed protein product [Strongylus vulgaris]|uniref:Uncharacterized protein n=1 Tax=Strongylus vulgaris TaxID=40348 RepID=A0A3P7KA23_STRVU|nr:unnamed protein product [Strongylus vulgaris]